MADQRDVRWPWDDPLLIALAERDGGWRCAYCGCDLAASLDDVHETTIAAFACNAGWAWPEGDHVIPKSAGGSHGIENRVLACTKCNQRKGTRSAEAFRAILAGTA